MKKEEEKTPPTSAVQTQLKAPAISLEEQFVKIEKEDEFEQFDEEEIKDAQELGDATIETDEIRKPRCKCQKAKGMPYCDVAEQWIRNIVSYTGKQFNYLMAEAIYFSYLDRNITSTESQKQEYEKNLDQITKDLERTFPGQKHFKRTTAGTTGITQLKNLLRATARRNSKLGYVQGMNFIMGALFYHSCEVVAFWTFDILLHEYGLCKVFNSELTGLYLHGSVLDLLIEAKYPKIWERLSEFGLTSLHFCTEWVVSLFSSQVDINLIAKLYEDFFKEGWISFYKVAMAVIDKCKDQLLVNDFSEKLFDIGKIKIGGFAEILSKIGSEEKSKKMIWKEILKHSKKWVVKKEVILEVWSGFNEFTLKMEKMVDIATLSAGFHLPG